jgi:hypothetical protein
MKAISQSLVCIWEKGWLIPLAGTNFENFHDNHMQCFSTILCHQALPTTRVLFSCMGSTLCVCSIQAHNGECFCHSLNPYQVGGEIMSNDCEGTQNFYIFWLYYINMLKLIFLDHFLFFLRFPILNELHTTHLRGWWLLHTFSHYIKNKSGLKSKYNTCCNLSCVTY